MSFEIDHVGLKAGGGNKSLLVFDTAYTYKMMKDLQLECFATCRDLGGYFKNVWTIHPVASLLDPPDSTNQYRSSVMRKTHLFQKSIATDLAFIQELSIYGEFVQIPKVLFKYFGREKWNTVHEDYKVFFGKEKKPWWYLPFVVLFYSHWKRVLVSPIPFSIKLRLWNIIIWYEVGQVALKTLIKISGLLYPERWKDRLGTIIYWRWMHSPNVKVTSNDLFLERVIKPKLGWW